MKGKIIVIEGNDCSGKETQSKMLEQSLLSKGLKCMRMDFPNYNSPTGKIISDCYLGKSGKSYFPEGANNVDPFIASLYYAADRKYNISKNIIDCYNDGYYIILDRYTSSNQAHQGAKIKDKDERFNMYQWIDKLEYWLLKLHKPDITIYLHVPYDYVSLLIEDRGLSTENKKDIAYLKKSEEAYVELSELYFWKRVDCVSDNKLKSIDEIHKEIIDIVYK